METVIHFAAESHVDRSITGREEFITTNINGTFTLLEAVCFFWTDFEGKLFHHVSTDEVYGSLGDEGFFTENTPYDPRSPYSAAASNQNSAGNRHTHLMQASNRQLNGILITGNG